MSPTATSTTDSPSPTKLPDFDNPPTGAARPSALAHIVLRAWDLPKMRDWYIKFLNAQVRHENAMVCFLSYDDEHHRIALVNGGKEGEGRRRLDDTTLMHFAFTHRTLPALLLAYRQRLALGISPLYTVHHGPTVSLYYQDPEGNQLETQWDAFDTAEEANVYMESDEFAQNMLGFDFEPEDWIERLKAGESVESLRRERRGGRGLGDLPEEMRV